MLKVYGRPEGYKPKCYQCDAVKKWLDKAGVAYEYLDVDDHMEHLDQIGIRQLPVVEVRKGVAFGGFDIGKLQQIAAGN